MNYINKKYKINNYKMIKIHNNLKNKSKYSYNNCNYKKKMNEFSYIIYFYFIIY